MADLGAMRAPLFPPCGLGHGTTRDPSLPESVPCWLARGPGTRQDLQRSSGQTPPPEAPAHLTQVLGVTGRSSTEWSPLFVSGATGQAEGLLLVEVAGHAAAG